MWALGLNVAFGGNGEWAMCKRIRESLPVQRGAKSRHQTKGSSGHFNELPKSRKGGERHFPLGFWAFSISFLKLVPWEMLFPVIPGFYEIALCSSNKLIFYYYFKI